MIAPTPPPPPPGDPMLDKRIRATLEKYWGFSTLRPLQREAIDATLADRDSLVVLPTGGGKSLCYQLPPLLQPRALCVVVSPLIALMKDQVDGLRMAGYPAAALYSGVSNDEFSATRAGLLSGELKLLLVAPERLLTPSMLSLLVKAQVTSIAIDEAHCISQWGHDFRPEYRRLAELRDVFPGVPLHAYTATATPRVRDDIVQQLKLIDPAVLVGTFDRPNLTYRILPRIGNGHDQIEDIVRRHQTGGGGEATIIYCISRANTESLAAELTARSLKAEAYHAGLSPNRRHEVQDDFINERLNIVCATVAFGMGIDRGDVRCVIHAGMPKSVEAYQQETGRAGRDGLPSECVLLYSAGDAMKWSQLIDRSAQESEVEVAPDVIAAQHELLSQMQRLATGSRCRHKALSEYFGQEYQGAGGQEPGAEGENETWVGRTSRPTQSALPPALSCNACDICLNELDEVEDATTIAKKIISCIARLRGSRDDAFGTIYVADVLRGSGNAKIIQRNHHTLSTFALLRDLSKDEIVSYINQLVDLGVITRTSGQLPMLRLNAESAGVLKDQRSITLLKAKQIKPSRRRGEGATAAPGEATTASELAPAERALFEVLRQLRRRLASERHVPPYVVFWDTVLEELARRRPLTLSDFARIKGVGQAKRAQFGEAFVNAIREHSGEPPIEDLPTQPSSSTLESKPLSAARQEAFALFDRGMSIAEVGAAVNRAQSTTLQYLIEYIQESRPRDISPWIDQAIYELVSQTAAKLGTWKSRDIFDTLEGRVEWDHINITRAHQAVQLG